MFTTDLVLTIVRILVGLLFIGHGAQKLFGWFGGYGLAGTAQWMGSMGLHPSRLWATLAALSEFVGGILLTLGFLTPIGAAMIIGVMIMAIIQVHAEKGLWITEGGSEYALVNIGVMLLYGLLPPTRYAVDYYLPDVIGQTLLFVISLIAVLAGVLYAATQRTPNEPEEELRTRTS